MINIAGAVMLAAAAFGIGAGVGQQFGKGQNLAHAAERRAVLDKCISSLTEAVVTIAELQQEDAVSR